MSPVMHRVRGRAMKIAALVPRVVDTKNFAMLCDLSLDVKALKRDLDLHVASEKFDVKECAACCRIVDSLTSMLAKISQLAFNVVLMRSSILMVPEDIVDELKRIETEEYGRDVYDYVASRDAGGFVDPEDK